MKIVKHYWFVAIALITMISFSSCESDEERGFDISGLYGKTWWGDMGFEDRYGEPLYSYITFTSGAFTDHGVGTEERCYHNDELYRVYKFDWEIQNGWLYLYYSDSYTFIIEYPSVSGRYFYGTAEDGFEIRLEWVCLIFLLQLQSFCCKSAFSRPNGACKCGQSSSFSSSSVLSG